MKKHMMRVGISIFWLIAIGNIAFAIDNYRPYLHQSDVPDHPQLNLQGEYQTALWPGAATYSIDIEVPPGRNGLQPELNLYYSSHLTSQRPGLIGTGWDFTQNYIWRDVDYSFDDTSDDKYRLSLNGQTYELVYVSSENQFHTKIESFLQIKNQTGGNNTKNQFWTIKTKDGSTYRFGYNFDSELVSNLYSYATKWSLDLVNDTYANKIVYSYNESPNPNDFNAVYPYTIEYNNERSRAIQFVLETSDRPDKLLLYENGNKIREARRIKEIHVKAENQLVKKYVLDYSLIDANTRSFLTSLTIYGSDGATSLPPIAFQYHNISKGWLEDSSWKIPSDAYFGGNTDLGARLVDLNRDGLIDIARGDNTDKDTYINNGTTWVQDNTYNVPYTFGIVDTDNVDTGTRFEDINGDGLTDIVRADGPLDADRDAWVNNGNGWNSDNSSWNLPSGAHPIDLDSSYLDRGVRFVDLNGDGLTDILHNAGSTQKAYINNGAGWTDDSDWYPPAAAEFVDSLTTNEDQGARLGDVNGDALPDLILGSSGTRTTWLNTGNGWIEDSTYAIPSTVEFVTTSSGEDEGLRLADVNGDGLVDLLLGVGGVEQTWINNGAGFSEDTYWEIPENADFVTDEDGDNKGVRLADVNGDGLPDLVKARSTSESERRTWINKASKTYLLNAITNELGGATTIGYKPSTYVNNTGNDRLSDLGFNLWLVDRVSNNNGIAGPQSVISTIDHDYKGGLYDYEDKEFRGFSNVQEVKSDDSIILHSFHQSDSLKGIEYSTLTLGSSSNPYQAIDKRVNGTLNNGYYTALLISENKSLYDGQHIAPKITTTHYNYDIYGNVISIHHLGDNSTLGDEYFEYWQYLYNTNDWIVEKPKNYTLFASDNSTKFRETLFRYDNQSFGAAPTKGVVTWEERWLNGGSNPTRRYNYDSFGNLVQDTDPLGFVTSYTYGISDSSSTFVNKITNAKNQSSTFTYKLGTGNVLSEIDGNGNLKNYTYDVFGRIEKESLPYDDVSLPTKLYAYNLSGHAPTRITTAQRENSSLPGTFNVSYFYDGFNNLIQIKTEAESNQQIATNFYFDGLNRIVAQNIPYFTPFASGYSIPNGTVSIVNYTYDPLSRIIVIRNPDSTIKNITFNHWKIDSYDEKRDHVAYILDSRDQIIKVIEFTDQNYFVTDYSYDSTGNIMRINDSYRNSINYSYDSLGRKTNETTPDKGLIRFAYDANDNLITRTDSNGNIVSFTFDQLNRLTKQNSTGITINYTYDNINGTLTKIASSNFLTNFTYDKRLRKINETTVLDVGSYFTQYAYDAMDRVTLIKLPDGKNISYDYSPQGFMEKISDIADDISYTALNRPSQILYKNGLTTSYTFDSNTQRVSRIATSTKQNLEYNYDRSGNIISIYDASCNCNETMGYDNLSRLVFSRKKTLGGSVIFDYNYSYDALGDLVNISSTTGKTQFYFGATPKHSPLIVTDLNLKNDGGSCIQDSECQSGYCDNDGLGVIDDGWCFTPYNTSFDGQEIYNCEYSTGTGVVDCDERGPGDGLSFCSGVTYYREGCSNSCGYVDITSTFECTDTNCSCSTPQCDGKAAQGTISYCNKGGQSYFQDDCGTTATAEDTNSVCRSANSLQSGDGCTADAQCNGIQAGTGNCTSSCAYSLPTQPKITMSSIYPLTNLNVTQNQLFNVTTQVCCYNASCGSVNVSLDPEKHEYTSTSEKRCTNGICTVSLYGDIRFVYEDNIWKKIEDARSLKNVWQVEKREDPNFPADVIDFNYTSITLLVSVAEEKTGRDIDLKIYDKNDKTKKPGDDDGNLKNKDTKIRISNTGLGQIVVIDLTDTTSNLLDQEIKWGDNSTFIQLFVPNSQVLDDAYIDPNIPGAAYDGAATSIETSDVIDSEFPSLYDTENTQITASKLVLSMSDDANYTSVKVIVKDCLTATSVNAVAYTGSSPTTLKKTGPSQSCVNGTTLTLPLGYESDTSSTYWIGFEANKNVTLRVDNVGESRNWYYQSGSWVQDDSKAYQLNTTRTYQPQGLIKFNLSGLSIGTVQEAILRLHVSFGSDLATMQVYQASSDWNEETVNWNNPPSDMTNPILDSFVKSGSATENITLDVTNADFSGNAISFVLNHTTNQGISYGSKESGFPDRRPYLNVTYTESEGEKGLISSSVGSTPFYTNSSNPKSISLNQNQCQQVSWWVNATGSAGSAYEFFVFANLTSNPAISNETSHWNVTIAAVDTAPPVINNLQNTTTTNQSAFVTWSTNEAANHTLMIGICPSVSNINSYPNGSFVTSHSQLISGLSNSTSYCINITVSDSAANRANASLTFTSGSNPPQSDTTPPIISSLTNSTTTNQSAVIIWSTNEAANYTLTIGICPSHTNTNSYNNITFTTSRDQLASGLVNSTTYCINVTAFDASGNKGNNNISFKTASNPAQTQSSGTSNLSLTSFNETFSNSTNHNFEFNIRNNGTTTLTNINWTLSTGQINISAQNLLTLSSGENATIGVNYRYTQSSDYLVTATATDGSNQDSKNFYVYHDGLEVDLSILDTSGLQGTLELFIKNYLPVTLDNVTWLIAFSDDTFINSTNGTTLQPLENISIILAHVFPSSGSYWSVTQAWNYTLVGGLDAATIYI